MGTRYLSEVVRIKVGDNIYFIPKEVAKDLVIPDSPGWMGCNYSEFDKEFSQYRESENDNNE